MRVVDRAKGWGGELTQLCGWGHWGSQNSLVVGSWGWILPWVPLTSWGHGPSFQEKGTRGCVPSSKLDFSPQPAREHLCQGVGEKSLPISRSYWGRTMLSSTWPWNAGPALLPSWGYSRGRGSLARMCFVDSGKVFDRVPHMSCGGVLWGCPARLCQGCGVSGVQLQQQLSSNKSDLFPLGIGLLWTEFLGEEKGAEGVTFGLRFEDDVVLFMSSSGDLQLTLEVLP